MRVMRYLWFFILAALTSSLVLSGCGGGGAPVGNGGGGGGGGGAFAGRYDSVVSVDAGKNATVAITIGSDGSASGTLSVAVAKSQGRASGFTFPIGNYPITGTADADGSYQMTGSCSAGSFKVNGDFPNSSGDGYCNIFAGDSYFQGRLSTHWDIGATAITFSHEAETNFYSSTWVTDKVAPYDNSDELEISAYSKGESGGTRNLSVRIPADAKVGDTFTAVNRVVINFYEENNIIPLVWSADGGTCTLEAKDGKTARVSIVGATMARVPGFGGTGTYQIDGVVEVK